MLSFNKIKKNCDGVSPVIGVILMTAMTVLLVSTIATSMFALALQHGVPQANIALKEARGNISYLTGNEIILIHKGGDILYPRSIRIVVTGEGKEASKKGGHLENSSIANIDVEYTDLSGYNYVNSEGNRKDRYFYNTTNNTYIEYAKIIQGDAWQAGKKVVIFGADGRSPSNKNNVNKKWELNPGSRVTVTVIDIPTNEIIASVSANVKESGEVVGS